MNSTSVRVLILGILVAAFEASAQRISLPDFSGRGAGAVRTQLVNQLCDTADCVAATKVTVGGKPDMKKAKRELLQYFITGTVSKAKKGKGTQVELTVVPVKGSAKVKRVFPLEKNGTLAARNLQSAVDLIRGVVGPAEAAPQPTPEPTPTPTPTPYRAQPTPSEPTEPSEPPVAERAPEPAPPPPPTVKRSSYKPTVFALELGADILNRQLAYANATSNNVRQYDLAAFPLPTVKLEFYPLALGRNDALSGLGLEGAFGIAPFLQSRRQTATDQNEKYPTTAMKVDAGLRWRIVVSPTFPLAVTPFVGLRVQSFDVGPLAGTTTRLDGLPNIDFVGLRAGLGLEVPVVVNVLYLVGRFGILPIFSSGEIIAPANCAAPTVCFFRSGSTFGFEASAGLAVQLAKFLQIRATFEYTQYGISFKTEPTDTYVASGATDRYLGGNAALRLQF